jgi:hypothetical protein
VPYVNTSGGLFEPRRALMTLTMSSGASDSRSTSMFGWLLLNASTSFFFAASFGASSACSSR